MTILQKLKECGFDEKRIKLDSAEFDEAKNQCCIMFIYNDMCALTDAEKESIKSLVAQNMDNVSKSVVKFTKSCFDKIVILNQVKDYFDQNYKALATVFTDDDIEITKTDFGAKIVFNCDNITKNVLLNKDFVDDLQNFLSTKFFLEFDIVLNEKEEKINLNELIENSNDIENTLESCLKGEEKINKYQIEIGEVLFGKQILTKEPIFLKDINAYVGEKVLIAGTIDSIDFRTFKSKNTKTEDESPKTKMLIRLKDITGQVDVGCSVDNDYSELEQKIKVGDTVAVSVFVRLYQDNLSVRVVDINACVINTKEYKKVYRKVNSIYHYASPKPVTEVEQMDLFNLTDKHSNYWDTHDTVVVFDLETTGLSPSTCKVIEIGAVKIVKGSIKETFQVLINPGVEIPQEITEITHISNDMVANAPTIEQVLPDFYKFAYGAVLSAYNIGFDYQFIELEGERLRLLFNNEQIDTLQLARDKVPSLTNYKLGTVVKALNITLENAHRALADAYATAKVFVKLI